MSSGNGLGQQMPSSTTSGGANRPASKNRRKEKSSVGVNQFGRTFFHPPGGVSNGPGGYDHNNGPALIDHNQVLTQQQFNTTSG